MGIPRFTARLQHRSERLHRTSCSSPSRVDEDSRQHRHGRIAAIIDGPSLAYHVYYTVRHDRALQGVSVLQTDYTDYTDRLTAWLDELELAGFDVKHIHFDGVLPPSKKETRVSRLQASVNQLVNVRQRHDAHQKRHSRSQAGLLRFLSNSQDSVQLPAPAFLVVAVIEALLNSSYAARTAVIPGEADLFCVQSAREYHSKTGAASAIFTNDSDMLVLCQVPDVQIIMFEDLKLSADGSVVEMSATSFQPARIAQSVGLQDLMNVAFLMNEDTHTTFESAVRATKQSDVRQTPQYKQFCEAFETSFYVPQGTSTVVHHICKHLDPRISEFVHQTMAGFTRPRIDSIDVFLPFLIEDPSRATAWQIGGQIRILSYILAWCGTREISYVDEYLRKGLRVSHNRLSLAHDDLTGGLRAWSNWIQGLLDNMLGLEEITQWRLVGMGLVLADVREDGKSPPSPEDAAKVLAGRKPNQWHDLHLNAQYQAALYSLRMMKQLTELAWAKSRHNHVLLETQEELAKLHHLLGAMPDIAVLVDREARHDKAAWQDLTRKLLNAKYDMGTSSSEDSSEDEPTLPDAADGGGGGSRAATAVNSARFASNPFDALAS